MSRGAGFKQERELKFFFFRTWCTVRCKTRPTQRPKCIVQSGPKVHDSTSRQLGAQAAVTKRKFIPCRSFPCPAMAQTARVSSVDMTDNSTHTRSCRDERQPPSHTAQHPKSRIYSQDPRTNTPNVRDPPPTLSSAPEVIVVTYPLQLPNPGNIPVSFC